MSDNVNDPGTHNTMTVGRSGTIHRALGTTLGGIYPQCGAGYGRGGTSSRATGRRPTSEITCNKCRNIAERLDVRDAQDQS